MTAGPDLTPLKSVRLERYADILAHVIHFGTDRTEEVVERFGLTLEQWRAVDAAWASELALGAKRQQREQALAFSSTFNARRERLARQMPALASIGDAQAKAPDKPESSVPEVAAKPSGVPSFMLAAAAPSTAPSPGAPLSPWAAHASSPHITPPAAPPVAASAPVAEAPPANPLKTTTPCASPR